MSNINFPSSPYPGQIYTFNGNNWLWNGYTWTSQGIPGATGPIGPTGATGSQGIQGPTGPQGISPFYGDDFIDFGFSSGNEETYSEKVISDVNVISNSTIILKIYDSSDHPSTDALIEGVSLNVVSINPGSDFTVAAHSLNNTWGIYNFKYTIIN